VTDPSKKNAVIMGRKTYFSIPAGKRPLGGRVNVVLSTEPEKYDFPANVIVAKSLSESIAKIQEVASTIENVWIVGGHSVYKEAMESEFCHRIYYTNVLATFECDTFFPKITEDFQLVANDPDIPVEIQEENGVKYQFQIYEKVK